MYFRSLLAQSLSLVVWMCSRLVFAGHHQVHPAVVMVQYQHLSTQTVLVVVLGRPATNSRIPLRGWCGRLMVCYMIFVYFVLNFCLREEHRSRKSENELLTAFYLN